MDKHGLFDLSFKPLWVELRPESWSEYSDFSFLENFYHTFRKKPFSFLLHGPPGCGKTTFIELLLKKTTYHFEQLPAASCTLEEIRKLLKKYPSPLILFMDEIHRFAKSRQDFFLKPMEEGSLILIGATTESPFYYLTAPLLSRLQIKKISPPTVEDFSHVLMQAWKKKALFEVPDFVWSMLSEYCYPDFRRAIQALEYLGSQIESVNLNNSEEEEHDLREILKDYFNQNQLYSSSKKTKEYQLLSAFIKSIRGSDADASLLYLAKLLENTSDPTLIARRLVVLSSEDIGLANSQSFLLASQGLLAIEKIGLPEARIILSHITLYLALSPKSNSAYQAINKAQEFVSVNDFEVPGHLQNHSAKSSNYLYPHNSGGFVAQNYWPDNLEKKKLYKLAQSIFSNSAELKLSELWKKIKNKFNS